MKKQITTDVCGIESNSQGEGINFTKVARCEWDPPFEIALRVELNNDGVWYGFVLLDENGLRTECKEEKFKKYADLASGELTRSSSLTLKYKYLKYRNQWVFSSALREEQMRYIVEDAELEKLVETITQEIKTEVTNFRTNFSNLKKKASL